MEEFEMAAGRVITGFSKPYVAKYTANGSAVTYSDGMILARGVSVSLAPESADDNNFYADNVVAESAGGVFTGGTATLTVDGLNPNARALAMGLAEADTEGWIEDGDSTEAPYLAVGYIVRYMSGGDVIYVPTVLAKTKMAIPAEEAATQEDQIAWQTTAIDFTLMRDDTENHTWRYIGADCATEAAAVAALKAKLNITP
jgi:phi13 family phage major tail protein